MNKKHGVGCTTLAYALGRLFGLPIYVQKDSFMLDSYHKQLFPSVNKITASKKKGVFDIGSNIKKPYVKKFIIQAKVIVIPLEYGYESVLGAIETLSYIKSIKNKDFTDTPIVLILNKLVKEGSDRDIRYKEYVSNKIEEAGFNFTDKLILTFLRNSYSIYANFDSGEYFFEQFLTTEGKKIYSGQGKDTHCDYYINTLGGIESLKCLNKKYKLVGHHYTAFVLIANDITRKQIYKFVSKYIEYCDNYFNTYERNLNEYDDEFRYFFHRRMPRKKEKQEYLDIQNSGIIDKKLLHLKKIENSGLYLINRYQKIFQRTVIHNKEIKLIEDMSIISKAIFDFLDEDDFKYLPRKKYY